jgi:hypothetical protein
LNPTATFVIFSLIVEYYQFNYTHTRAPQICPARNTVDCQLAAKGENKVSDAGKSFAIKISQVPAIRVIGMKVRTNMSATATDCPKLYGTKPLRRACRKCRGITAQLTTFLKQWIIKAGVFDYWAAVSAAQDAPTPLGMEALDLPEGLYENP